MVSSEVLLGLPGYECIELGWESGAVRIRVRRKGAVECPHCGATRLRSKGWVRRQVRHEDWGLRRCWLELELRKWLCRECGRSFREPLPGIRPYQRSSEAFQRCVFQWHLDGVNRSRLARREGIGAATVERYFERGLKRQFGHWHPPRCPPVLGLDEHFFTRKKGYATTLVDLRHHKVYDVVLGRSELALEAYLQALQGKDAVKLVCMDLASVYRAIVRKHFPHARIVADRFHVVRLINHHFLSCWRDIDPVGSRHRGLLSLMRRHRRNLSPEQQIRLTAYLQQHPALETIYRFKQRLTYLLLKKHRTRPECAKLVPRLLKAIAQLRDCGLAQLVQLGETLFAWRNEIALMWRFTRSNGITEGFHNKMELINRQAYGFQNFQNYRMRVKVLCGGSA